MSLFHGTHRKNPNPSGKFLHIPRFGTEEAYGAEYHDWTYHLVRHMTGATLRRAVYTVTIFDSSGNRMAYLTDFPSLARAHAAARDWVDEMLSGSRDGPLLRKISHGVLKDL
ncbi:MAG: hypothetical protein JW829_17020 [Pirellulales bacterium]|nr:hypothetical protein [Pirellulales bacterium]